jgi:hypothetical protein
VFTLLALALALARELSGEAQLARAEQQASTARACHCGAPEHTAPETAPLSRQTRRELYVRVTEARFTGGVKRCC